MQNMFLVHKMFTKVFALRGFLNNLIPVFQTSNFFPNLFTDSIQGILLFRMSGNEVFKTPRNTNIPEIIFKKKIAQLLFYICILQDISGFKDRSVETNFLTILCFVEN